MAQGDPSYSMLMYNQICLDEQKYYKNFKGGIVKRKMFALCAEGIIKKRFLNKICKKKLPLLLISTNKVVLK